MNPFAEHIGPDELNLYIANKANRDQSERIKRHVGICEACKGTLVAGLLQAMGSLRQGDQRSAPVEKRANARLKSGESGFIQSISPLSFDRPAMQIDDISHGGIGLFVDCSLAPGTIVQVFTRTANALGEVVSCVSAEGSRFRVGIRVQASTPIDAKSGYSRKSTRSSPAGDDCDLIVG